MSLGRGTGQSFDPADSGRDRHFADDLEDPDIAGTADMSPAAQLHREGPVVVTGSSHRDYPHLLAVLLAKERERSLGDRAIRSQQARAHSSIRTDLLVDLRLDRLNVVLRQRPRVAEIEPQ